MNLEGNRQKPYTTSTSYMQPDIPMFTPLTTAAPKPAARFSFT